MANGGTTSMKMTRGDKAHKKFMDKFMVYKDGLKHSMDSFTTIHKQTLDAASKYTETVSKSQEAERASLYEVIKTSEDETRRREAYDRLTELDRIKDEEIKNHNEFSEKERDKANKNITGVVVCLAAAGGFISSKQGRQMLGKAFKKVEGNIPRLKG